MSTLIDELIISLGLDDKKFSSGEKRIISALSAMDKKSSKTADVMRKDNKKSAQSLQSIKTELLAIGAALMSINAIKSLASKLTADDAALGRMAANIDVSVERLSAWTKMADKAGGTAEGMAQSITGMSQRLQHFSLTGEGGEDFKYFTSLGISLTDAAGKARAFEDVMLDASDKLKEMADTKGLAHAQAWGKGMGFDEGTINVLVKGRKAVENLADEQRRLSIVSSEDVKQAREREIQWNKTRDSLEAVWRDLLTKLSPALTRLSAEFMEWIKSIDLEEVEKEIAKFVAMVENFDWAGARKGVNGFFDDIQPVVSVLKIVGELVDRIIDGWKMLTPFIKSTAEFLGKGAAQDVAWIKKAAKSAGIDLDKVTTESVVGGVMSMGKSVIDKATEIGKTMKDSIGQSPFAKLVSRGEGDYSSVNVHNQKNTAKSGKRDLANMTINQVLEQQEKHEFGAAGKYQMIRSTLKEGKEKMGLTGEEKFDPAMQDKMFNEYLVKKRKKLYDYIHGLSDDLAGAAKDAAMEWASFTDPTTGKGYYDNDKFGNQKASISADESMKAIQAQRAQYMSAKAAPTQSGGGGSSEVNIAQITVNTKATDAPGIAKDIGGALKSQQFANASNNQNG